MEKKMPLSTLKDKGQITLPSAVRKKLHADKGDIFNFEVVGEKVIMTLQKLVPARDRQGKAQTKGTDISKYIGSMKGAYGPVEQIDDYIRKERDSWN